MRRPSSSGTLARMEFQDHERDQPGWVDPALGDMSREERLLTACAWCQRVKVEDRWVSADAAIRELRTYEWLEPPLFTHGVCEQCLDFLNRSQAPADDDVLPSQAA
jgi:hypothetical protein